MTTVAIEAAAAYLAAARRDHRTGPGIPEACRPTELDAALAIQRRVMALLGGTIGGWKCSVPTQARPVLCAPIYAATVVAAPARPAVVAGDLVKIEPEIALVIGRDLPPRAQPYTEAEVRDAVREARLVLELIGSRYADPTRVSFPELLADSVANQGIFIGPVVEGALDRPLDRLAILVSAPSRTLFTREGVHPDGHPLRPLVWLANFLAARGEALRAGQVVTTGSYCGMLDVPLGVPLVVQAGDLPPLSVTLDRAT